MTEPQQNPAEQTAALVEADYPGIHQSEPRDFGERLLHVVRLPLRGPVSYRWQGYTVRVNVGDPDHLNRDDPDDAALHRPIRAEAVLPVETPPGRVRGPVAWGKFNPAPEVVFPAAYGVGVVDPDDPQLAGPGVTAAILSTVAQALDQADAATTAAAGHLAKALHEAQFDRGRPPGTPPSVWRRRMRAEHAERTAGDDGHQEPRTPSGS